MADLDEDELPALRNDLAIDIQALHLAGGIRPKPGAKPGPNGMLSDDDVEVVISLQMGVRRSVGLVGADGMARGVMVPVGEVSCSLAAFKRVAKVRLGGQEIAADAAEAAKS